MIIHNLTRFSFDFLSAKDIELKNPEDVGFAHTHVFRQLAQKYRKNGPKTYTQLIADVVKINLTVCEDTDETCKSIIYRNSVNGFLYTKGKVKNHPLIAGKRKRRTKITFNNDEKEERDDIFRYPFHFDADIKEFIESIFALIDQASDVGREELLRQIQIIQENLEEMTNNAEEKESNSDILIGKVACNVAIESAILWFDVIENIDHPLHDLQGRFNIIDERSEDPYGNLKGRYLEEDEEGEIKLNYSILADLSTAVSVLLNDTFNNQNILDQATLFTTAFSASVSASASAYFSTLDIHLENPPILGPPPEPDFEYHH